MSARWVTVAACAAGLAVAACGGPAVPMQPPAACPPALAVAPAILDEDGYRVDLAWRGAAAPDTPPAGDVPGYVIARLGLGPLPAALWLLRVDQPACQARIAGYRATPLDDGVVLSARLDGCAGDEAAAVAWASLVGTDPTACRVVTPVQTRGGDAPGADDPAAADPPAVDPAAEAPLAPPRDDVAAALPEAWDARLPAPCDGCARRWTLDAIAGTPALGAVVAIDTVPAELADPADPDPAAAPTSCARAVIAAGTRAAPLSDTRDVALVGALADAAGTRVALLRGPARWEVIDVDAEGRPGARRTVDVGPPPPDLTPPCAP
jgi:hypothetical protein